MLLCLYPALQLALLAFVAHSRLPLHVPAHCLRYTPKYIHPSVLQVTVHAHAAQDAGVISSLTSILDPKSGQVAKQRPRAVLKGQTAVLEINPVRPLCLELYADFRALGRVVLRDGGQTLAVGIVTALAQH